MIYPRPLLCGRINDKVERLRRRPYLPWSTKTVDCLKCGLYRGRVRRVQVRNNELGCAVAVGQRSTQHVDDCRRTTARVLEPGRVLRAIPFIRTIDLDEYVDSGNADCSANFPVYRCLRTSNCRHRLPTATLLAAIEAA